MKKLVLDTHTLSWYLSAPKKLGTEARRVLSLVDQDRAIALIPAIVPIELALLREINRKVVGPLEVRALISENPNFQILPMDLEQSIEFMMLNSLREPFDRMIASAARCLSAPLITADEKIKASRLVDVIWD